MKLTGAAILVSRGMKVLQAAPGSLSVRRQGSCMIVTCNFDDGFDEDRDDNYADDLLRAETELAAAIRQFDRASQAQDDPAKVIELEAIGDRIRRILYVHLEIRIGMTSDAWVWMDGQEDIRVELAGMELKASGRIRCTLANGPLRYWTEPFTAVVIQASTDLGLADYTISWGSRETLLDLAAVERLVVRGETMSPPAPSREDAWAYVFRMNSRRTKRSS